MNPKVKAEWIAALRSGEYKQCRQQLRDPNGWCCLGVLVDIVGEYEWELESDRTLGWSYDNGFCTLPGEIIEKAQITSEVEARLITMNDCGASFETIANWIEENL